MDLTSIDHLLTMTRAVRKRLDLRRPVEPEVIERCIEIAIQAPTGSNMPRYHFLIVTDPDKRVRLGELYCKVVHEEYLPSRRAEQSPFPETETAFFESVIYLADHLHEVPVHIIPCFATRVEDQGVYPQAAMYGSILPATWSLMLALRARGLGSSLTTLHLRYEREAAELLAIPCNVTQAALLPVAYFTGVDFKPAKRVPGRDRTYWNGWGATRA
jgi:nitroreductase